MKLNAFTKTYSGRLVLDFPGAELEAEKIYAVVGANGSGKSTFAKLIAGIEKPDNGKKAAETAEVAYMPQKSYAFRLTLKKNLLLKSNDIAKAERLIEALGLKGLENNPAKHLSGGETAKMALARLMMEPCRLLVLDEPTASMDIESTFLTESLIRDYCSETGCAVIIITHSLQQARRMADHILFFSKGRLEEIGLTEELLLNPKSEETAKFIDFYGIEK